MQQEETTDETQVETEEGQTETVEETETEGGEVESPSETTETPKDKLTYEQKLAQAKTPEEKFTIANAEANKNRRLLSKKPMAARPKTSSASPTNVEETVLLANGMNEELVAELKVVAGLRNTTLIKAQNDPIFVAIKEKFEKDKKHKDASLGASRGAGGVKPKKDFNTPGLSREDHRKMVLGQ